MRSREKILFLSADHLQEQADARIREAEQLPDGEARQNALKNAAQLRSYADMKRLLTSVPKSKKTADQAASHDRAPRISGGLSFVSKFAEFQDHPALPFASTIASPRLIDLLISGNGLLQHTSSRMMRIVLFTDVSVFRRSLSRNGLLVMFDPAKSHESVETVVDDLASSQSWDDTNTKLTFKLHEGVKQHDGKPFTAKDVQCTWNMLIAKAEVADFRKKPRQVWYFNLDEVTVNGNYEATFNLNP